MSVLQRRSRWYLRAYNGIVAIAKNQETGVARMGRSLFLYFLKYRRQVLAFILFRNAGDNNSNYSFAPQQF